MLRAAVSAVMIDLFTTTNDHALAADLRGRAQDHDLQTVVPFIR
jgi:hypothetical protein